MALTLAQADSYVAEILGGKNDTNIKAQAREALAAAMEIWTMRHDWSFLRQDTSNSFIVTCSAASGSTTVASTGTALKNVLVGMTVSGTSIQAGTTVTAIASASSITISLATTGTISSGSLTFGGTIPIIAGTASYTLPSTFHKPGTCRLVSTLKTPLIFIPYNQLDNLTYDQTIQGAVTHYTLYNAVPFDATGTMQGKIKFWRVPAAADVALLKYYRPMDVTASNVDCSERYLYTLLDYARMLLLMAKDGSNPRIPVWRLDMEKRLRECIENDYQEAGEDQMDHFVTPFESGVGIGFDGNFWPNSDTVFPYS